MSSCPKLKKVEKNDNIGGLFREAWDLEAVISKNPVTNQRQTF